MRTLYASRAFSSEQSARNHNHQPGTSVSSAPRSVRSEPLQNVVVFSSDPRPDPQREAREPLHREIATLATMTEDAKKAVVTIASIADDVSSGAYCERMRIGDVQCRAAWLGLMDFILNAIRNNKVRHATDARAIF